MDNFEAYWLLFTDTLVANIFFTFKAEMVNRTMVMFGKYDKYVVAVISTFAATLAAMINYLFGWMFYNIYRNSRDPILKRNYNIIKKCFSGAGILLVSLNVIPSLGMLTMVIAGFIRLSVLKVCAIIFVSRHLYYLFSF
ncbi:MAG: hypothetical protein K0Q51_1577 [Rickettsiaceae bacterium]|jgi:membrane protein YqaA with SNARE-associated domain|nr:hypothetical protein [Rickettsiaceae bacterium]